ncbi:hypothetical protein HHX38_18010 [Streptomyces sp. PKU-MA01144]|uniref:type II toxin-antitoxin system HicB family antitoxin n=1 Tax=Streptomyces sp. PKU-MA01144 TaxID=2729138 RepID=UPI0014801C5F|nr:hypothetical protein [Streptomyces sp. PKU-MA01144]NNJ06014.1 hypothetical protein [Streptomyces sp. PKU-MA01144]
MTTGYQARLRRIGRWWAVDVPELAIHTQCRTLDEAEDMAREAIAEALGTVPDTVGVELVVPEFAPLLHSVTEARRRRAAADSAERQALSDAVRTLVEDLCVSQGDACRLLGMSHQTVARLSPARGSADARPWRLDGRAAAQRSLGPGSGTRAGDGVDVGGSGPGGTGGTGGTGGPGAAGGCGGGRHAGAADRVAGGGDEADDAHRPQRAPERRPGGSSHPGDTARANGQRPAASVVRPRWAIAEDEP